MIPNKINLSRTLKKPESVDEKRVSRSGNRKHTYFVFALQSMQHINQSTSGYIISHNLANALH